MATRPRGPAIVLLAAFVLLAVFVLLAALLAAGCGHGGQPGADAAVDVGDAAMDSPADQAREAADLGVPDAPTAELGLDGPAADLGPDLPPLPKRKILFAHGSSPSALTLATINMDGTGKLPVPGFASALDLTTPTHLRGRENQLYPFTPDIPQEETRLMYPQIRLPRGLGQRMVAAEIGGCGGWAPKWR